MELPINSFEDQIIASIIENPVTIIQAETGAGKSTQVPQFLLQAGMSVLVTQPRKIAAFSVAKRVAYEYGCEFGSTIGYRTSDQNMSSPQTKCLFVTDGLALVRELMGHSNRKFDVLVIDEVHEWNMNIEVLVAWVKHLLGEDPSFRVVLMSATMEVEKLSAFFDCDSINVPGRLFEVVVEQPQGSTHVDDVARLLRQRRNVLVFESGKAEITDTISRLVDMNIHAEILPLHGELSPEEQQRCFETYKRPVCIVATNVAQTSITLPNIDAVVDTGMERRVEVLNGVEGLYLKPISLADAKQRKGRAGRCKKGIYIDWCAEPERLEFPKPEIQRQRLDQVVLRLANAGFDMEELNFFHQPPVSEIHSARLTLKALGCIDSSGQITKVGQEISKLPTSVVSGKMLIEGAKRGVLADMIKIVCILEQGGITIRPKKTASERWRYSVRDERDSDVMAQLYLFNWINDNNLNANGMRELDIFPRSFFQAKDMYRKLVQHLEAITPIKSTGNRDEILKAVTAGMITHVYMSNYGEYRQGINYSEEPSRSLSRGSVVRPSLHQWVVGIPFDLTLQGNYGPFTIYMIQMITSIQPEWLKEIAPHLFTVEVTEDNRSEWMVWKTKTTRFNGKVIKVEPMCETVTKPTPSPIVPEKPQFNTMTHAFDSLKAH